MSIRLMTAVWDKFPASGSELLCMLALADFANDDGGSVHPSISTLAKKIRVSESQARRILHGLIDLGYVEVIGNESGGAPGTTRQYKLNVHKICNQTTSADARGGIGARGRMGARDGSHGCAETASMGASLTINRTINEPSNTGDQSPVSSGRGPKTFSNWLSEVKESGEQPVSEYGALLRYCQSVGLPLEFVRIAWERFTDYYTNSEKGRKKKYKDWRLHFLGAVKGNWYRIWYMGEGGFALTTIGQQAHRELESADA